MEETLKIVRDLQGDIQGIAILVDRSGGKFKPEYPLFSLLQMNVETFESDQLPEDLKVIPAVHPGSR